MQNHRLCGVHTTKKYLELQKEKENGQESLDLVGVLVWSTLINQTRQVYQLEDLLVVSASTTTCFTFVSASTFIVISVVPIGTLGWFA
jgi:hypothetical protein